MKTKTAPSVVPTCTPAAASGFTLGLDLGDRQHHVCVLDAAGQIVREGSLPNTRPALAQLLVEFPHATIALEAGTHSPWISRCLTGTGSAREKKRAVVAVARKLAVLLLSLWKHGTDYEPRATVASGLAMTPA